MMLGKDLCCRHQTSALRGCAGRSGAEVGAVDQLGTLCTVAKLLPVLTQLGERLLPRLLLLSPSSIRIL